MALVCTIGVMMDRAAYGKHLKTLFAIARITKRYASVPRTAKNPSITSRHLIIPRYQE